MTPAEVAALVPWKTVLVHIKPGRSETMLFVEHVNGRIVGVDVHGVGHALPDNWFRSAAPHEVPPEWQFGTQASGPSDAVLAACVGAAATLHAMAMPSAGYRAINDGGETVATLARAMAARLSAPVEAPEGLTEEDHAHPANVAARREARLRKARDVRVAEAAKAELLRVLDRFACERINDHDGAEALTGARRVLFEADLSAVLASVKP